MNSFRPSLDRLKFLFAPALALLQLAGAWSAEPSGSAVPGATEFAGRLARNHWYLLGEGKRAELEAVNRELRAAQQQLGQARDDEARRAAAARSTKAAARLLEHVQACPGLIRVDLTGLRPRLAPGGPFEMPGDTGALLFEVVSAGNGLACATAVFDCRYRRRKSLITLDVPASGTNYAALGLEHLPSGGKALGVIFRWPGQPKAQVSFDVTTPQPGRLKLTVLSDDTSKPVPAMVRLLWSTDGLVRQPGNGIEFAPQFDKQGKASGARNANLPGPLADSFWCVPGPVDMTLAPGTWRIGVRRGVEHEVIFEDITIPSGQTIERTLRPRRWVDMRQRGWWSGDDHVHCRILSDAHARHLMAWVQAEDVHLANVVKMGDIYRTYFEQRGFGPNYRVVDGEFVLVPGQECPRTHDQMGHTLAMNITRMVRNTDRYYLYDEVFDAVHAQGGLTGYAHVNSDMFHVHRDMSMNVPRQKVDFAEILQFNRLGTDLYYEFLNLGCKLTASSGSDVPWGGTIGEVRVYTRLDKKPFSAAAWFEAFAKGRTFTTSGPMLDFRVDDALPGDELRFQADRQFRVRARAWGDPKRMAPVKLEIVRHGDVIRSAESRDPQRPEAELDFTVPAGHGCWLAARAQAGDGTSAHTTPVYVMREGLRFWKHDALGGLFERRRANLAEIEQIIADARRDDAAGKLDDNRNHKQLALQGDLLLERVAHARQLYADLERIAQAERPQRAAP